MPSQFGASSRVEDAGRNQCPVDHAVERIEHPLPGDGGERDRHRERQNDQRPHDLAAGERPQQQEGAELSEHEAEQLRSEREDEGVAQRLDESRVFDDLLEVRQTDKLPGRIVDRVGADRIIDREQKRQTDQQQDIDDRRRDQNRFEHVAPVQHEVKAGDRLGDRFCDDGHR